VADTKYIFFLDIDGTVLNDDVICERNRRAIDAVRKAGHLVFINTGRAKGILPGQLSELELDGRVMAMGSNIEVAGKEIKNDLIPTAELSQILGYCNDSGRKILFEGNDIVIINEHFTDCWYDAAVVKNGQEFTEKYGDREIPKVFIPHVLTREEAEMFSEKYMFCQHPTYVEISPKGNDKATAIGCVLDYLLPQKYVSVAMGDSLNDLEMLRYADISVAMGDSHEKILPLCDIITCNARDGGVAEAMERITGLDFSL